MRVAITFRDQAEHERCSNEHCYPSLSRREPESLPHFIEFETPTLFNHEYLCDFFRVYLLAGRHGVCKLKLSLCSFIRRYALVFSSVIRLHLTMDETNPKAVAGKLAASEMSLPCLPRYPVVVYLFLVRRLGECRRRDATSDRAASSHGLFSSQSFWKAGSARNGSQSGSSLKSAGVIAGGP